MQNTPEQLFARFAEAGDVEALAGVFHVVAPRLLRLALHLAPGEGMAGAEDLLQSTFVVAIEKARRFDRSRALEPWLAGILAKEARKLIAQRRRAAALARDQVLEHPIEAAERGELAQALRAALERIGGRYRDVVQLRLFEGLNAPEIAARLQRSPGSIRVQLHRGLAKLKRLLPPGLALGVVGAVPSRGLLAVESAVLAQVGARAATGVPLLFGVLVMKHTWIAAAATLAAGIGAWWWVDARGPAPRQEQEPEPRAAMAVASGPAQSRPSGGEALAPTPVRTALASPRENVAGPEPFDASLVLVEPFTAKILVVDAALQPVAGATVELCDAQKFPRFAASTHQRPYDFEGRAADAVPFVVAETAANGRLGVTSNRECAYVHAFKPDVGEAAWRALRDSRRGDAADLVLQLTPFVKVGGRVVRAEEPVADAELTALLNGGHDRYRMPRLGRSDREGRFEVELVEGSSWQIQARKDGSSTPWEYLHGSAGSLRGECILRFPDAYVVDGLLLGPDGKPCAGKVEATSVPERPLARGTVDPSAQFSVATAKSDGNFRLAFGRAGRYQVVAEADAATTSEPWRIEVGPGSRHALLTLQLVATGAVRGVIRRNGEPVGGASVILWVRDGQPEYELLRERQQYRELPEATTAGDGSFEVRGLHPRALYSLRCRPDPQRPSYSFVRAEPVVAGMRDLEFVLTEPVMKLGDVHLRVLGLDGAPVRRYRYMKVTVFPNDSGGGDQKRTDVDDPDGRCVIRDVPFRDRHSAGIWVEGQPAFLVPPWIMDRDVVTVTARVQQPGSIRALVVDVEGRPLANVSISGMLRPVYLPPLIEARSTDAQGFATLAGLAPGTYEVSASGVGARELRQKTEVRPGQTSDVVLKAAR